MTNDTRADTPSDMLVKMSRAPRFNRWMADTLAPFIAGDVLELGAGIGNLTALLSPGRSRYVAADVDPQHLNYLQGRTAQLPNVDIVTCDVLNQSDLEPFRREIDSVVCINVLEHIDDDVAALQNMYSCLRAGGRCVVLVPQGMSAFGTIDTILQHHRRYSESELQQKITACGFRVETILKFNRVTYPGWFFNGRILRTRKLSRFQLHYFDLLVPLWRRIDRFLPWPPTSLIAIGIRDN